MARLFALKEPLYALFTPLGNEEFRHKEDHLCFWLEEESALFTGDIVMGRGSVRPIQTFVMNYVDYKSSMRKIESLQARILYPSHGDTAIPGQKVRVYGRFWTTCSIAVRENSRFSELSSLNQRHCQISSPRCTATCLQTC